MNRKDILKLAAVAALLLIFIGAASWTGRMQSSEEARIVRDAVRRAALTCYAVEGAFPDDLDYLRENYHLSYNEDRFIVSYDAFAFNRIPDIYVLERGAMTR